MVYILLLIIQPVISNQGKKEKDILINLQLLASVVTDTLVVLVVVLAVLLVVLAVVVVVLAVVVVVLAVLVVLAVVVVLDRLVAGSTVVTS